MTVVFACCAGFLGAFLSSVVWTWNNHSVAILARRASVISDGLIYTMQFVNFGVVFFVSPYAAPFAIAGGMLGTYRIVTRMQREQERRDRADIAA